MKVYLTEKYELVIEAESAVETIALKAWSDDYFKEKPDKAMLLLSFTTTENAKDKAESKAEWSARQPY